MESVVVTQACGTQLQDGLARRTVVPKLLGSFDPLIDLLDKRLRQRTRDRQPFAAVTRIIHAMTVVGEVGHPARNDLARIRVGKFFILRRFTQPRLPIA